jgi:hypothetical protein
MAEYQPSPGQGRGIYQWVMLNIRTLTSKSREQSLYLLHGCWIWSVVLARASPSWGLEGLLVLAISKTDRSQKKVLAPIGP